MKCDTARMHTGKRHILLETSGGKSLCDRQGPWQSRRPLTKTARRLICKTCLERAEKARRAGILIPEAME